MKQFLAVITFSIILGVAPIISSAEEIIGCGWTRRCPEGMVCQGPNYRDQATCVFTDTTNGGNNNTPPPPAAPERPTWYQRIASLFTPQALLTPATPVIPQAYMAPTIPTPTPTRPAYFTPAITNTIPEMPCGEEDTEETATEPTSSGALGTIARACLAPRCIRMISHPATGQYEEFKKCKADAQKKYDDTKALIDAQLTEKIKSYETAYNALPKEEKIYIYVHNSPPLTTGYQYITLKKLSSNLIDLINGCKTPISDIQGSGVESCLYKIQEEYKKQTKTTQYNLTPQALKDIIGAIVNFEKNSIKPQLDTAVKLHREENNNCWKNYPHTEPWSECLQYEQTNCPLGP